MLPEKETKTFELAIYSDRWLTVFGLIKPIEKGLKGRGVRVVSLTEYVTCQMCGETARVVTTFGAERPRWWQFWKFYGPDEYSFDTDHPCMKNAADEFADPDSPWKRKVAQ